jgi:hypothetical protein
MRLIPAIVQVSDPGFGIGKTVGDTEYCAHSISLRIVVLGMGSATAEPELYRLNLRSLGIVAMSL